MPKTMDFYLPKSMDFSLPFTISRQTVRRAVETLERRHLLERIRGSGTYVTMPKHTLDPGVKCVGVITTCLDDYKFLELFEGIHSVLFTAGYAMLLNITYNKTGNEAKSLESMLNFGIDGLIIEGTKSALPNANMGLFRILREKGIPIIFVNGYYNESFDSYVVMDDVKAGELASEFLIKKNHSKIACIFKSDDMQGVKRYEGVCKQINKRRLHLEEQSFIWYTSEELDYLFDGKMDGILIKRIGDATAIICYNDDIAVKVIKLLERNGKSIPQDISIISFDDSFLANQEAYNLTSVTYDGEKIGKTAAEHLLMQIEGIENNCKVKISPTLKLRQSVKKL